MLRAQKIIITVLIVFMGVFMIRAKRSANEKIKYFLIILNI